MTFAAASLAAALVAAQVTSEPAAQTSPPPSAAIAPAEPSAEVSTVTVTARRPTTVAGVTVTATDWCPEPQPARYPATSDPQVIDSYPQQGGATAPGLTQLRITFDAPMSCYAEVTSEGGERDPCEPLGVWTLPDRRSFLLRCRLESGVAYTFRFRRDTGRGFIGLSGRDAEPFSLRFNTTSADPVISWTRAQAADPGPPGSVAPRTYVTCADVKEAADSSDCRHQRFGEPTPPP